MTARFHRCVLHPLNNSNLSFACHYSTDLVQENDPNDPFDSMKTSNFLSLLTHPGVPPHELHLKVGAVCMKHLWKMV